MNLKFLLALLNSKLLTFWYRTFYSSLQLAGGYIRIDNTQLKSIPIPDANETLQLQFIKLTEVILDNTKDEDYLSNLTKQSKVHEFAKQIDQLVYKLYGLTPEEIEIVERGQ